MRRGNTNAPKVKLFGDNLSNVIMACFKSPTKIQTFAAGGLGFTNLYFGHEQARKLSEI
jgi:hypothetical protein